MVRRGAALVLTLLVCTGVLLQTSTAMQAPSAAPKFEVVSIKPFVRTGTPIMFPNGWTPFLPGGKFVTPVTTLRQLIGSAYSIPHTDLQIDGLPPWERTDLFSVEATPGDALTDVPREQQRAQVLLMLQSMLADYFRLKIHVEERPADIYELRLTGREPKGMKAAAEGVAKPGLEPGLNAAMGDNNGRMIGNGTAMKGIANGLTVFFGRPVIDKTGVSGYYDFDIHWVNDSPAPSSGLGQVGLSLLITNLRDQLGLRLVSARGPQKFWVVDHVEKPDRN
jgi:uncharacterized protein (TIGR03435 family)